MVVPLRCANYNCTFCERSFRIETHLRHNVTAEGFYRGKRLSTSKVDLCGNLTVALDAMGGDFGPRVAVPAAVRALSYFPELSHSHR
ncbi:hypothetical protein O9992_02930 [Vibrio lentus]|nr:hypothetical protein [Vibrio lentus]